MATEVGVAYVRLLPSMQGFSAAVNKELGATLSGPADKAGKDAGRALGSGVSDGVDSQKGKLSGSASRMGDLFKAGLAAAGLAAGVALTAGITSALDAEAAKDKLSAQLGGGEFGAEMGEVAGRLYTQAFGDSVADTSDAVRQVLQSGILGEDQQSAANIERLTADALTFADVLDQDLNMSLQAVDRMLASGLASSADEAFDVLTKGIQSGVDRSGDLTETFQEYSTMFREIGLDGSDAMGLLSLGLQAGARDADTVADSLKEFAIRAQDGSTASAKGFEAIGLSAADMTAAVAQGGPAARDALDQVLKGLQSMEDPAERNAAAVALFGTKAEDLGDALFNLDLDRAGMLMHDAAGSAEGLGSAYDNAQTKITAFKRQAMDKIVQVIGNHVIPAVETLAATLGPMLGGAFRVLQDIVGPAVEQLQAFWYTLTSGFTEDEGTPIEFLALSIRDALAAIMPALQSFVSFVTDTVVPNVQAGLGVLADLWAEHGAAVMETVGQLAVLVADVFALIVEAVQLGTEVALGVWSLFGDEIVAVASIALGLVSGVFRGALDIVQGIVRTATAIMRGDWSAALDGIKQAVSGFWTLVKTVFRAGFDSIELAASVGWRLIKATFVKIGTESVQWVKSNLIDRIIGFFRAFGGRVKGAMSNVAGAISSPFRTAFDAIKSLWNRTAGGFGFSIPDWIPRIGGKSFSIPKMHTGGIVGGPPGSDQLRVLQAGEGVFTREQMAAMGTAETVAPGAVEIKVNVAGGSEEVKSMIRRWVRVEGGGNVQLAIGS